MQDGLSERYFMQIYGNVIRDADSGEFRMWYNVAGDPDFREGTSGGIAYATSIDGLNWRRPKLDKFEYKGQPLTNLVIQGTQRLPTVFPTPNDPDRGRRYRLITYLGRDMIDMREEMKSGIRFGYGVFFSPDGLSWTEYGHNPVIQGSDMCTCFYDPVTKLYVAYVKHLSTVGGVFRRCVGVTTSSDFLHWTNVQTILSADEIDDARVRDRLYRYQDTLMYDNPAYYSADIYGMTGMRYEGLLLGLIWLYDRSGCTPKEHGGNDDGIINVQLAYTRDNNPYAFWSRPADRRDVLSCGTPQESDSAGMITPASNVNEVGDEIWLYYTAYQGPHMGDILGLPGTPRPLSKKPLDGTTINLATMRRDGFASIYSGYLPGELTTQSLTFTGNELEINAIADHGEIRVEVLDESNNPLSGFSSNDCIPICEDSVRINVKWKGSNQLNKLQGKPIRLKFSITMGRLFAFKFND